MRRTLYGLALVAGLLTVFLMLLPSPRVEAQGNRIGVYTYHYDNKRTGWNGNETLLSQASVSGGQFGKRWSRPVDGQVYAQPLYAPDLNLGALGAHNVVFVATEHNSVYAFDADTGGSAPLWQVSLGPSVPSPSVMGCRDIEGPEYGITSTPVIDPAARTMYVVAKTWESGRQIFRLHALDITTGQSRAGWPVEIRGSVAGNGGGSSGGRITFNPTIQLQRAGLLLLNDRVVIGVGSTCDSDIIRYHGWIFSYSASDPSQAPQIWCATPDFSQGPFPESAAGVWQAGFGPAADEAGNIYFETGNGLFNADLGGRNIGNSFVRLETFGGNLTFIPSPANYFTPSNERALDKVDADLGSGGCMIIPDQPDVTTPHLLVGCGKDGVVRLLNRDFLGGHTGRIDASTPDNALQDWPGLGGTWSGPAYWEGPDGNYIFYTGVNNPLRRFRIGLRPDGSSRAWLFLSRQSTDRFTVFPNSTPVVSSDGKKPGTGIVWLLSRTNNNLRAYSAENPTTVLWHSRMVAGDTLDGSVVKFSLPIVANGKVYAGTRTAIVCYGLQ